MVDNQIIDDQIIAHHEYELDILKNKICVVCKNNFHNLLHKNKKILKRKDFAYYVLFGNNMELYTHEYCLNKLYEIYINDHGKLNINGVKVEKIHLYNRYGQLMTKTNYIKNVGDWLKNKTFEEFCTHVSHMYIKKERFAFHCRDYIFNNIYLNKFNLAKNDFSYKSCHVDKDLQPDTIGLYLSR